MQTKLLHQPYTISLDVYDVFPERCVQNNFFELVYIVSGTGRQCINHNKSTYAPGHVLLLSPQDKHAFEIETATTFFFLRFNNIYIRNMPLQQTCIHRLEFILENVNHQPGCILKSAADRTLAQSVIDAIIREYVNRDLYNTELVEQMINVLILVIGRNVTKQFPEEAKVSREEKILDILQYIQQHIYHPEKLKAETIATSFDLSEHYLGRYFKRHTKETLQAYIANYKTRLIENRLLYSDMRVNEIAREFGFTDESHLNKFFKKQNGKTPRHFRVEEKVMS